MASKEAASSSQPSSGGGASSQASALQFWSKFYNQALTLASSSSTTSTNNTNNTNNSNIENEKQNQKVMIALDTITKIIFGLDGSVKEQIIHHDNGALELIVALVLSSTAIPPHDSNNEADNKNNEDVKEKKEFNKEEEQVLISTVKAIKTCVLRNPAGRSRCRAANVFHVLNYTLHSILIQNHHTSEKEEENNHATIVEETFTTLAAACLGDDLNALQASQQLSKYLTAASTQYPKETHSSLHQKIQYLTALFDTMTNEQSKLLQFISLSPSSSQQQDFFTDLRTAEIEATKASKCISKSNNPKQAQVHLDKATLLLQPYMNYTTLIHSFMVEIRSLRAKVLLENDSVEKCIEDALFLLEDLTISGIVPAKMKNEMQDIMTRAKEVQQKIEKDDKGNKEEEDGASS